MRRSSGRRERRLRVVVVSPYYAPEHSGSAPYVTQVAEHLAQSHDVTVLTGVPHYPSWQVAPGYDRWRRVTREQGVSLRRLRHYVPQTQSTLKRAWYELSFALRVLFEVPRVRPDVVVAFTPPVLSTAAARVLAGVHRAGFGVVVHDLAGLAARESGIKGGRSVAGIVAGVEQRALASADGAVVLHPKFARHVPGYDAGSTRHRVIRNWSKPQRVSRSRAATRAEVGWPDSAFVVLHSGNMGMKQGLENVVEAARLADERADDVRFVLMGDGSRRSALEDAGRDVRSLSILPPAPESLFFDMLHAADALLVNEKEGVSEMSVPSKLTAYFAAGRPVVAASDPASPASAEVDEAQAGPRVDSGDPAALLETVLDVRSDGERAERWGTSGRDFAEREFAAGNALAKYDDWVAELAASRGR